MLPVAKSFCASSAHNDDAFDHGNITANCDVKDDRNLDVSDIDTSLSEYISSRDARTSKVSSLVTKIMMKNIC